MLLGSSRSGSAGNGSREKMLNARRPCFYTFYSSTLSSETLKLPVRFLRHLKEHTYGLVSLIGPSGHTWYVDLIQQNDELYLTHGWPIFVRDHFLECGDFLVFRYDGELQFVVQVFDQSACEKEAAFNSQCSQDHRDVNKHVGHKREREEYASSSDACIESMAKKTSPISEADLECMEKNQEHRLVISGEGGCQEDSPNLQDKFCLPMLSTHDEREVARGFTSDFPYFVRSMKSFNISGSYTLNIPYKFSMAHLPNSKIKIFLRNFKGESWTVNSVPATRVNTSHTLCGGWMAFVRGNDIRMGDICIFELIRECELHVHILGFGKQQSECQGVKGISSRLLVSHKTFKDKLKKMVGNSSMAGSTKFEVPDKKGSRTLWDSAYSNGIRKHRSVTKASNKTAVCSQSNRSSKSLVIHRSSVNDDLGSKQGLRMMLALDEERAARSFTSCFPSFVRIMKRFNVCGSYTLKIPHQFSMAHLPDSKAEIVLRNQNGKCWTVNSVPDSKGRMVHTFCGGWGAFVRDNDVKIGDICIFELVSKREMRVHASGVGRTGLTDNSEGNQEVMCNDLALVPVD